MKRLALLLAGGAVWLLLAAAPVFADNGPHHQGASPVTDGCSGCHRAHTGQASNLLASSSQTSLCYTCHGSTGTGATTDVQDGVQYAPVNASQVGTTTRTGSGLTFAGGLRGGGFDNSVIDTAMSGPLSTGANAGKIGYLSTFVATTSKHNVDAMGMAWGMGAISGTPVPGTSISLTCASCHDPHGKGQYRILKPQPRTPGPIIAIGDVTSYVYTTSDYWHPEDSTAGGTAYIANVSAWCASCHTRYLAPAGSATVASGDAIFTYRHESNGTTFVGDASGPTPTCVQCHVSHGSSAAMGTNSQAEPLPGDTVGRGADSNLLRIDNRGVCEKCHNK